MLVNDVITIIIVVVVNIYFVYPRTFHGFSDQITKQNIHCNYTTRMAEKACQKNIERRSAMKSAAIMFVM